MLVCRGSSNFAVPQPTNIKNSNFNAFSTYVLMYIIWTYLHTVTVLESEVITKFVPTFLMLELFKLIYETFY